MANTLQSVAALSAARVGSAALQFAILPIIARHLSPQEFGVVALAMVFVMIAMVLSDAGMGRSLLRDATIDDLVWSSAFWLFAVLGLVLAGCVLGLAPIVAYLYDSPELLPLVSALAIVPFLQSISAVFFAELEKRRAFLVLALITIVSAVLANIAAVWLAVMGAGAWALVAQQIVLFTLQAILTVAFSRFRPHLRFSFSVLGPHLRFGLDTLGWSLVQLVYRQSLPFVVGKVGSMTQLGAVAMAVRFTRLPGLAIGDPIGRVVYVRMAAAHASPGAVERLFLSGTRILAAIVIPSILMVAVCGEAFFTVLLSDRWAPVAPIFALLAPGVALQVALSLNGVAFMASGRTDLRLRAVVEMTVIWLVALAVAAPFGVLAIAGARSISMILFIPRMAVFAQKAFGANLRGIFECLVRPLFTSIIAAAVHIVLTSQFGLVPKWEIVLACVLLLTAWVALTLLDRHNLKRDFSSLQGTDPQPAGE